MDIAGLYAPALKRPEGETDPDPKTSLRLKGVLSGLLEGQHDPEVFTPPMRVFLVTTTGKGFWQWFAAHGKLESFTFSDHEETVDGRVLRYKAVLGGNPYWLSVDLTRDGKIAQIRWW